MNNGELIHGFKKVTAKSVKDINSDVNKFIHEKSGAELLHFSNNDTNKVFIIGFKTPPENSYGIPHILEHCVLNGSRKFNCKEPFVELLKGSMQTFTNAMTYPDKTVYPVASTNDKDFFNLMDVYMDAVFFPNIYTVPEIFKQEGWHYELNNPNDELNIKGVVYNEMEGAFSSPEQILFRSIKRFLLEDTIYSHESGGDPDEIPNLTYEEFIAFHKKYYHPSNCKIILYGDGSQREQLKFLNDGFLDQFQKKDFVHNNWVQSTPPKQSSYELKYPLSNDESETNKSFLTQSFITGKNLDPKTIMGIDMLEHILLGTPASPLKNALLNADMGKDIFGSFNEELLQPIFTIAVKHADPERKTEFENIIKDTLESLVRDGLNKKIVQASVNIKEFELREADFSGLPKGLIFGLYSLSHWMYSDDPIEILEFDRCITEIKQNIDKGYFEDLIQKYFLNNTHRITVTLNPVKGLSHTRSLEKSKKLDKIKADFSKDKIDECIVSTQLLKERQTKEDSDEDLRSIPLLKLSDLQRKSEIIKLEQYEIEGKKILLHPGDTHGISYLKYFFNTDTVLQSDLPYLSIYTSLLGKISTNKYTYHELSNEILFHTGGIGFSNKTLQSLDTENFSSKLLVSARVLNPKISNANELIMNILSDSRFDDKKRIKEILNEIKSRIEMVIMQSGNQVASVRLLSYINPQGMYNELTGGLDYYHFISNILTSFDSEFDSLQAKLEDISKRVFNKKYLTIGIIGENENVSNLNKEIHQIIEQIPYNEIPLEQYNFNPKILNEGLIIPGRVQYVTQGYNFKKLGFTFSGSMSVFGRLAGLDYLWNTVRAQGGAYGSFVSINRNGNTIFSSYRDPNLSKTFTAYKGIAGYLKRFNPSDREMRKYIIGTVSALDKPLSPLMKGETAIARHFKQISDDIIQKHREEVLGTEKKNIQDLSSIMEEVLNKKMICVVGNETKLTENKSIFGEVTPIFN